MKKTLIHYCSTHRDQWKLVYWDDNSLLYVKNIPKYEELVDKYTYQVIDLYIVAFRTSEFDSIRTELKDAFRKEFDRKYTEEPNGIILETIAEYIRIGN